MPREEESPHPSNSQNDQISSDSGNAGSGGGNEGAASTDSQAAPGSEPVIKPITLEPHQRGLFEIPRILRRREK